jgi:hypothetical protein|tara:strand:+ start:14667 stop:15155 length:489 start_codon:yes stop_codon:yes gene_type:complete
MATIALTKGSATAVGSSQLYGKPVKTLYFIYDLVDAVASKGSALAAGDVIQGLGIPGNSWVQSVAVKVNEAAAEATTLNFDVGFAGDIDMYGDHLDATSAAMQVPTALNFTGTASQLTTTYDTIDIQIDTYTGTTLATGQITVFATIVDLSAQAGSNIADVQ